MIKDELLSPPTREMLLGTKIPEWQAYFEAEKTKILRHQDLFSVSEFKAEVFARKEADRHFSQYIHDRSLGLCNSERSVKPGISVLIPKWARTTIDCRSENKTETDNFTTMGNYIRQIKMPTGLIGEPINPNSIIEVNKLNFLLFLTYGVYAKVYDGIEVHQEVNPQFSETDFLQIPASELKGRFMMLPEEVIRVMGRGNTLWQNPNYHINGSLKTKTLK